MRLRFKFSVEARQVLGESPGRVQNRLAFATHSIAAVPTPKSVQTGLSGWTGDSIRYTHNHAPLQTGHLRHVLLATR